MIKLNITKKDYNGTIVLKNINLCIEEGSFVSIVGKSGSGKTTLLNLIGLLDTFDGEYYLNEEKISEKKDKYRANARMNNFGYVFQFFNLDNEYTAYENVELPLLISGRKDKNSQKKIYQLLEKVGLEGKENRKISQLSGGEAQRVAIARALVNDAKIILADEPCGSLDTANSKIIMDFFKKLNNEGITIILVTHNEEDAKCGKRKIVLSDGEIVNDISI